MIKPTLKNSGVALKLQRSFTVPQIASFPMSPPGKNSGSTTNESVVNARLSPFMTNKAESPRHSEFHFQIPEKQSFINSLLRFPPLPWLNKICPLFIVCIYKSLTRSFCRNHTSAHRIIRGTYFPDSLQSVGSFSPSGFHHKYTFCFLGFR